MDLDSIQYSCTVLVLIQLYSLNGTHSSIRILFWSYFSYIQLYSTVFTEWDSFQYLYTVLVLIQSFFLYLNSFLHLFTDLVLIQSLCNIFQAFLQPYTDLVQIQLFSLIGTQFSTLALNWL